LSGTIRGYASGSSRLASNDVNSIYKLEILFCNNGEGQGGSTTANNDSSCMRIEGRTLFRHRRVDISELWVVGEVIFPLLSNLKECYYRNIFKALCLASSSFKIQKGPVFCHSLRRSQINQDEVSLYSIRFKTNRNDSKHRDPTIDVQIASRVSCQFNLITKLW
jgi:hypothetical protein